VQDFRDLDVWTESIELVAAVYSATKMLPADERFGMSSQMRRSATSISANIAEGCGRQTRNDFARFLRMAYGSACELETHCRVALRVGFGDSGELTAIASESERIRRMLASLQRSVLNGRPHPQTDSRGQTENRRPRTEN